jgi:hypothetical protein
VNKKLSCKIIETNASFKDQFLEQGSQTRVPQYSIKESKKEKETFAMKFKFTSGFGQQFCFVDVPWRDIFSVICGP